jgi:Rrf2 family protein
MLSQKARYALRALVELAREPKAQRTAAEISVRADAPRKFLEAILLELARRGLVVSRRGKLGGYVLAKPPETISFAEVIRVIDGPLALAPCVSRNFYKRCDDCADEATCTLRRVLAQVRNLASEILDQTTLAAALAGASASALADEPISEAVGQA